MKIISVVGARPNFIKIAPFIREINNYNNSVKDELRIDHLLVHTGQHYDKNMSDTFFSELNIPQPNINLGIGSGSHAEQVGKTMIEFEKVLHKEKPDWVVVVGDVNATLACSVTAKKELVKVCHIEAGIRSGDMSMPEEINRIVTDRVSDLLLAPDRLAIENLNNEGVEKEKIRFVGNIMIDSLDYNIKKADSINLIDIIENNTIEGFSGRFNGDRRHSLVTLHRPSNVDYDNIFRDIINFFSGEVCNDYILLWPVHPRTYKRLHEIRIMDELIQKRNIVLLNPLSYMEMIRLSGSASLIITDSGGVQEESTIMGIPCLTLRNSTERQETLTKNGGTSILAGNNIEDIRKNYRLIKENSYSPFRPELWDGHAAQRCLNEIINY